MSNPNPLTEAAPDLAQSLRACVAELETILPEFDPSGENPAWLTLMNSAALLQQLYPHETPSRYLP